MFRYRMQFNAREYCRLMTSQQPCGGSVVHPNHGVEGDRRRVLLPKPLSLGLSTAKCAHVVTLLISTRVQK